MSLGSVSSLAASTMLAITEKLYLFFPNYACVEKRQGSTEKASGFER